MKESNSKFKYRYMAWWFNPKYQKHQLTPYSPKFRILKDAEVWYKNHGKKLEKMFNRELVFKEI